MRRQSLKTAFVSCVALVLMLSATLAAQSRKDRDDAKKFKDQAAKAFAAKNYREAADLYGKALALVTNDADGHYRKGFAHFELKENDQAVAEFTLALEQGYKPPLSIYQVRYYAYREQKNHDAALADIQKGLELAPGDINFLNAIGEVYFDRKAYTEAIAAFQKALQTAPNSADIHYNMARTYFEMGDAKAQQAAAEQALAKGTRFPGETHYILADAYFKQRNAEGAIDAYQKAINSQPDKSVQAYRNLAEVYRNENRFTDAINVSKQGLRVFPNDGNLYTDLGLYYSLAERHKDAVDASRAGVSILPNQHAGYTNLCRAYNETKEYSLAVTACNAALRLKPGDGETLFYLGRAHDLAGREAEAGKFYAQAVKGLLQNVAGNPESSESWYLLGNAYFTDGQRDKAISAYLKCLEIAPKFAKARYNLGIIYTLKKDKVAAVAQYDKLAPVDARLAEKLRAEIDKI